jgi:hypothetical protein
VADFSGGEISTDAGLMPLKKLDEDLRYTERISRLVWDGRNPLLIQHETSELLRQRLFGIIAGYEDCNDHKLLRHDPIFKVISGKKDLQEALASQPTLSRLEERSHADDIVALDEFLTDFFIQEHRSHPPARVMLDVDSTDDPCHGHQQLALFNGHDAQYMYLPLLIFEGYSGYLLGTKLRSGTSANTEGLLPMLHRRIIKLRNAWPQVQIEFRGDAGFQTPELLEFQEEENVVYAVGMAGNDVLYREVQTLRETVKQRYEQTKEPQRMYMSFEYAAGTWSHKRRMIAKVEYNKEGENIRFVVTNRTGTAEEVYTWYRQRGECENRIEELKNDLKMDRLSCETFRANAFRLMLHALAYNLVCAFRRRLKNSDLETATVATMRWKLFKIGALVKQSVRRIWIQMSSSWPFRSLYEQAYAASSP